MEHKYSIAFIPDAIIIEEVKKMKLQLAYEIGWYNSKNSLAHITICEFTSTEIEITKKQVDRITASFSPFDVELVDFDSYSNGAFFIKPSEKSKEDLKKIMKNLTASLTIKKMYKSSEPHLSIARKLDDTKLKIASDLFQKIELFFFCDRVFLRKFNPELKQFDVIDSFLFKGEKSTHIIQGSLF
ncbi:2'-5' RNA ligase family protein [uncultured Flavobacterium sp.]|uniref:2'-5' RNA ligase family protein n=1 Tax=uncultured Flavobacterium sp. TaxID=165435 RepID=UPI0030EE734B|tara:strand:+ start:355694 stop:356248 length:555 start_codon:yes stop_codon:yes gene_type:complete